MSNEKGTITGWIGAILLAVAFTTVVLLIAHWSKKEDALDRANAITVSTQPDFSNGRLIVKWQVPIRSLMEYTNPPNSLYFPALGCILNDMSDKNVYYHAITNELAIGRAYDLDMDNDIITFTIAIPPQNQ